MKRILVAAVLCVSAVSFAGEKAAASKEKAMEKKADMSRCPATGVMKGDKDRGRQRRLQMR